MTDAEKGVIVAEKVKEIIAKKLNVSMDKLHNEAEFNSDLGADSLDQVELVLVLEQEFNCEIPEVDQAQVRTVGDIIKFIEKHGTL